MSKIDTQRLYALERLFPSEKNLALQHLQTIAAKIWDIEATHNQEFPIITFSNPHYFSRAHRDFSFCMTDVDSPTVIVLANGHHKVTVLIHELTHALGYWQHDMKFVKKYFSILDSWTVLKFDYLFLLACVVKLDVEKLK